MSSSHPANMFFHPWCNCIAPSANEASRAAAKSANLRLVPFAALHPCFTYCNFTYQLSGSLGSWVSFQHSQVVLWSFEVKISIHGNLLGVLTHSEFNNTGLVAAQKTTSNPWYLSCIYYGMLVKQSKTHKMQRVEGQRTFNFNGIGPMLLKKTLQELFLKSFHLMLKPAHMFPIHMGPIHKCHRSKKSTYISSSVYI